MTAVASAAKMQRSPPLVLTLYGVVAAVALSLTLLLLVIPLALRDIETLRTDWEHEFKSVKSLSDDLWSDLLALHTKLRLPRERLRRQQYAAANDAYTSGQAAYEGHGAAASYGGGVSSSSSSSSYDAPINSYNYNYAPEPPLAAPTFGYGIAKVKCCCAMSSIDYEVQRKLPVSSKCAAGARGLPGDRGEQGDSGANGAAGYNGENYPIFASQPHSSRGGARSSTGYGEAYSSLLPSNGGYGGHSPAYGGGGDGGDDAYGGFGEETTLAPSQCAPCPRGIQGSPGPKGSTGKIGNKGDRGTPGVHGIPAAPGASGSPGTVGRRGRSGMAGAYGPRGVDGRAYLKGTRGVKGQAGSIGVPGIRGPTGPAGSHGYEGLSGRLGLRGSKGQRGLEGMDGIQGPPGLLGIDAGYCKCPARIRDVQAANSYGGYDGGSPALSSAGGAYSTLPSRSGGSRYGSAPSAQPPAATPADPYSPSSGSSRAMEHRYGVVNEAGYDVRPKQSATRELTTSLHVGDLRTTNIQGTRREYHQQSTNGGGGSGGYDARPIATQPGYAPQPPTSGYQSTRSSINYFDTSNGYGGGAQTQRPAAYETRISHVAPPAPPPATQYTTGVERAGYTTDDQSATVVTDWGDEARRRRALLAQRTRRLQRFYGRS